LLLVEGGGRGGGEGVGEGREKSEKERERERGKQTTPTGERKHADRLHASHDPVLPYTLLH